MWFYDGRILVLYPILFNIQNNLELWWWQIPNLASYIQELSQDTLQFQQLTINWLKNRFLCEFKNFTKGKFSLYKSFFDDSDVPRKFQLYKWSPISFWLQNRGNRHGMTWITAFIIFIISSLIVELGCSSTKK